MVRVYLVAALLVLLFAGTADAKPLRRPAGLVWIASTCPYNSAAACSDGHRVWMDPRLTGDIRTFTALHELGHGADQQFLDPGERNRLMRLMRVSGPWYQSENSPHERFADAYALCGLGWSPGGDDWIAGGHGYEPTRRQHRLVCGTIRRALGD